MLQFLVIVFIRDLIFDDLGIRKYLLESKTELKYQMKTCL